MKIAIFQPPYPIEGTAASASECLRWIQERLEGLNPGEHDLVLLPEYANAPGLCERESVHEFAQSQGTRFLQAVRVAAARLRSLVVLSAPVRSGERWFNRTLVFDSMGEILSTYDKMHLTDVEKDDLGLTPGARPSVFEHAGVRIGFATCFDLYFPEHFGTLAAQSADVVLCPSYQRSESAERIRLIAQARALDSGVYVIRSSYAMSTPNIGGHSLVATPAGALLADLGNDACVRTVEIDPRKKWTKPASYGGPSEEHRMLIEAHRRPAAYRPRSDRVQQIVGSPFPRLCAHRGLSKTCPENTLPAFAAAIACGAHEIECDVWMSRDGIPVVCHDESVDRTTNGRGKVADLTWEEISRLDAGMPYGEVWTGVRMPRLEEVLERTDGLVGLNIHIKEEGPDGNTIKRACDLITEGALTQTAYLALGTERALQIAREYAPEVVRACLVRQTEPALSIAIAERHACQRIQFGRQVTKEQIHKAHEIGLLCNLFWSDEPGDAMRYVGDGIDVILTNCAHTIISAGFNALRHGPAKPGALSSGNLRWSS